MLELDNTRLQTQSVGRTASPVWNKQFNIVIRDTVVLYRNIDCH